ncbi:receptor-type adenylate cyclase, putative [Bodo saltans]|uniref:adenylate cyclase n=1 Tax=Bodo saltans TaxID=75058 RepID=A0A0S4JAX2_BODSA|nr:receptor-type adenylate cyclase, putative [Bodo saltans]|eukprot:CUG87349.1 receptor-type adenylate cyclase, putative [Bodo saltans]
MTDQMFQFDGVQSYAGMKAAEKEINDNNIIGGGVNISIEFISAPSFLGTPADVDNAIRNATVGRFGFIMPDWATASSVTRIVQNEYNSSIPVVAPRLLTTSEVVNKNRFSLNLRQPPSIEYLAILQYALGSAESRCTAFTLITRSLIDTSQVAVTLAALGLPTPLLINLPFPGSLANLSFSPSAILDTWYASNAAYSGYAPPCGLFFALPSDIISILDAMYTDARFNMSQMTFFVSAQSSEGIWNTSSHGTAPFARVRFITNFVDPQNSTIPFTLRYQTALKAYLTSLNVSALPAELTVYPMLSVPTYPALEGYLAVRWAAEILSRMPSITPSAFLDAVYDRHIFYMNDVSLGPMTDHCLVPNTFSIPCFCNIGASSLAVGGINLTTGIAGSMTFDSVEQDVSEVQLPMNQCYLSTSNMQTPLLISTWLGWNVTGASATTSNAFAYLIRHQVSLYNEVGSLSNIQMSAVNMNSVMPMLPGETNAAYFNRLYATRRPTLIVGQQFPNVSAPVMNIVASSTTILQDALFTRPDNFTRYSWNLQSVFADLAHVLANFISDTYMMLSPRVVVISDEDAVQKLAVKSLHTFQIDPETPSQRDLQTLATIQGLVNDAASTAAAGKLTILMVASRTPQVVANALNAVAALPGAANPNSLLAQNLIIIAGSSQTTMYAVTLLVNATALVNIPIIFPSPYMAFWEPNNSHRLRVQSLLNTSNPSILSISSLYTALVVVDLFTALAESVNVRFPTASLLADAMYKLRAVTVEGIILGPVDSDVCSPALLQSQNPDRSCQCYKLLQTFSVFDFRDWLQSTANHQINYQWSMGTCGVIYQPLALPSKLNAALIAGCAAAGGVVLIVSVFYFACCFGRRNNRSAPKDPNEPFAMVFTDIQSSTSLWARAPEAMGEALDQHHSMLRSLVSKHDGYEVKTIGDSFMVAFKSASDATRFGLAIQTELFGVSWHADIDDVYIALASEAHEDMVMNEDPKKAEERRKTEAGRLHQWEDPNNYPLNWNGIRVRVGMHWGMGSIKLDPVSQGYDYYGTLVNTAARVEGVGNGGQVLATHDFYVQLESEGMNLSHVDVKPLGPQPLRGLDQPVPLYQLCPMELRSREFAELRLDIEVDIEDTTETTTHNDGATVSSVPFDDTPITMMARLLKRQKNAGAVFDYLTRVAQFMDTLLRTSPMSYRKDAVKHYMKKWHVHARKPRDTKEPAETTLSFDIAALVVRVGLASEEARRVGSTHGGSQANKTDGASDAGYAAGRRKQSTSRVMNRVKSFSDSGNEELMAASAKSDGIE